MIKWVSWSEPIESVIPGKSMERREDKLKPRKNISPGRTILCNGRSPMKLTCHQVAYWSPCVISSHQGLWFGFTASKWAFGNSSSQASLDEGDPRSWGVQNLHSCHHDLLCSGGFWWVFTWDTASHSHISCEVLQQTSSINFLPSICFGHSNFLNIWPNH